METYNDGILGVVASVKPPLRGHRVDAGRPEPASYTLKFMITMITGEACKSSLRRKRRTLFNFLKLGVPATLICRKRTSVDETCAAGWRIPAAGVVGRETLDRRQRAACVQ